MNAPRVIPVGLLVVALSLLTGCEPPVSPLEQAVTNAPAVGRAATTTALETSFLAGDLTFQSCLEHAEALLEAGHPDATVFAGAVLDLAVRIEDRFPTGGEYELFWMRMGQLASKAAFAAMEAGRFDEADTLVLAGPTRWQRENYWRQYPNHDIMVAISLAHQDQSARGIARLRSRVVQTPEMEAAIEQIRELDRRRLRNRLKAQIEQEETGQSQPGG